MSSWKKQFTQFSSLQRWQATFLIIGIFCYKYAWESASVLPFTINKFDLEAKKTKTNPRTFAQLGCLILLSIFFAILGSSLVAPLVKRWRLRTVLVLCAFLKTILSAAMLVLEAATGGTLKPANWHVTHKADDHGFYGTYSPYALIPLFAFSGLFSGAIWTLTRTAPRQIVGGDPWKLQTLNAVIMIFFEIAAIAGALCSALIFIPRFGENFPILMPVFAALAAVAWCFLKGLPSPGQGLSGSEATKEEDSTPKQTPPSPSSNRKRAASDFFPFKSIWRGARILCQSRDSAWLLLGFPLVQYSHACLEGTVAPAVAKRVLGDANYVQIIIAGSNIGELLGAFAAMFLQRHMPTPIPWVRLSVLANLLVWLFPVWYPPAHRTWSAWQAALVFLPMGAAWSAAAVSMFSYLQALFPDDAVEGGEGEAEGQGERGGKRSLPPLSCVLSALFAVEIVIVGLANPLLGSYIDHVYGAMGGPKGGVVQPAFWYLGGAQYTIMTVLVLVSTLVPKGALQLNPKLPDYVTSQADSDSSQKDNS